MMFRYEHVKPGEEEGSLVHFTATVISFTRRRKRLIKKVANFRFTSKLYEAVGRHL